MAAINGIEDVDTYLNPDEQHINDPYKLKNVHKAVDMVVNAVLNKKMITVFLDADADGELSGSIMYNYLRNLTENVQYLYGSRTAGHGLHTVLDSIPNDTQLLVVLDSSSSEWKESKKIKELGMELLIIDHHEIENPNYYCVLVNPKQDDCEYDNKNISCSALVWQFCRVLDDMFSQDFANQYIDLAALGLISDVMPMSNLENRAIVNLGLNNISNIGIKAILKHKKLDGKKLSTTDIGFNVTNLLNATARMDQIGKAIELLTCDNYVEADELVKEIDKLNTQRKKAQSDHTEFVNELIDKGLIDPTQKVIIVLDHEKRIQKNFAGLIANDISKKYQRPCLILSPDAKTGNTYAGSYRSYGGFDLKSFFESTGIANYAAGHIGAGGVGLDKDKIQPFVEKVQQMSQELDFEEVIEYDLELDYQEIDEQIINEVNEFYRITGNGFQLGKFLIKGLAVYDNENVVVMGKNKDTVKVVCDNLTLMKFKTTEEYAKQIPLFTEFEAVGTLNVNSYFNFKERRLIKTNQLFLEEYKTVS